MDIERSIEFLENSIVAMQNGKSGTVDLDLLLKLMVGVIKNINDRIMIDHELIRRLLERQKESKLY